MIGIKTKKAASRQTSPPLPPPPKVVPEPGKKFPEVDQFLESVGMMKYREVLISNGFEDLETILELRDEDFATMRVPLGHKLKMLKRIKELKPVASKPPPVIQSAQTPLHGIQKTDAVASASTDAPQPEEKKAAAPKKAVRFGEQAVIIEFSGGNPATEPQAAEDLKENIKKAIDGQSDKENTARTANAVVTQKEDTGTANAGQSFMMLKECEERECCWNCYRLFVKDKGFRDEVNKKVIMPQTHARAIGILRRVVLEQVH